MDDSMKITDSGFTAPRADSKTPAAKAQTSFAETLSKLLDQVNSLQHEAGSAAEGLLTGKVENLHEVMIAMGKAEVSFKFLMEARNKLVDAYREIMRMQV